VPLPFPLLPFSPLGMERGRERPGSHHPHSSPLRWPSDPFPRFLRRKNEVPRSLFFPPFPPGLLGIEHKGEGSAMRPPSFTLSLSCEKGITADEARGRHAFFFFLIWDKRVEESGRLFSFSEAPELLTRLKRRESGFSPPHLKNIGGSCFPPPFLPPFEEEAPPLPSPR